MHQDGRQVKIKDPRREPKTELNGLKQTTRQYTQITKRFSIA
jgi:hypothetical protein